MSDENLDKYHKGRGAQVNVANKFLKTSIVQEHYEGLDEELIVQPQTQFFEEHPKKIISRPDSPDISFMFSINPYQGCEHGCIYCYARNAHEYWGYSAGIDFETKIMVKKNAPELLKKAFDNKNWEPNTIVFSGNTDCYQPAERKYGLTREMMKICLQYKNPASIITKNAVILRDLDVLGEMGKLRLVQVMVSITTLNEDLRQRMEPRTVTGRQRMKVIEKLTLAGVPVGIMTAPLIPGLNSHEVPELIKMAADHGALGAGYTIVRLNGAIGEIFTDWIHKNYPDRANKVLNHIKECHGGRLSDSRFGTRMRGEGNIAESIRQMHRLARHRYMAGREFPELDHTLFQRPGQIKLF